MCSAGSGCIWSPISFRANICKNLSFDICRIRASNSSGNRRVCSRSVHRFYRKAFASALGGGVYRRLCCRVIFYIFRYDPPGDTETAHRSDLKPSLGGANAASAVAALRSARLAKASLSTFRARAQSRASCRTQHFRTAVWPWSEQ
jgi:hypothetical protein